MSNFELSSPQSYVNQLAQPRSLSGQFFVQFWGVRGLISTSVSNTYRYGGNTPCVEMQVGGKRLIFDGGTGLRILGKNWSQLEQNLSAYLFFTNSQANRIQGFPFFTPAFIPDNKLHIYGTAATNSASIKQCLCDQMLSPHFPYPFQVMQAELEFNNLMPGQEIKLDEITITTALINQTQRSVGYRVSWQDYSVAYITDLYQELSESEKTGICQLAAGADLLIANSTYVSPVRQYSSSEDSQYQAAVDLANIAQVKQLVISCHHPDDDDEFLDELTKKIAAVFPKTLVAHEGLNLIISQG
ncbi:MBL fold metallo-hydrolase [Calothrix sp. 336/3]|uniref:MBL fold metallo-hydrolase n=1 Tax=Calothrix sp. 336/3 TaxID=1337936 RepID=UPI0004E42E09|nr:MBL fold metallo-hydrolase [Calothrix sp. 336/3]AKG22961.1 beta-lactamase [Calothrix sp. 336/3]